MSKAKKIAISADTSGNISGNNLSGTNTGSPTVIISGSNTIYKFTTSGSITF